MLRTLLVITQCRIIRLIYISQSAGAFPITRVGAHIVARFAAL